MELAQGPFFFYKSIPERGAPSRRHQLASAKSRLSRTRIDPIVNALKSFRFEASSRVKRTQTRLNPRRWWYEEPHGSPDLRRGTGRSRKWRTLSTLSGKFGAGDIFQAQKALCREIENHDWLCGFNVVLATFGRTIAAFAGLQALRCSRSSVPGPGDSRTSKIAQVRLTPFVKVLASNSKSVSSLPAGGFRR
jgi:hypothetical protein